MTNWVVPLATSITDVTARSWTTRQMTGYFYSHGCSLKTKNARPSNVQSSNDHLAGMFTSSYSIWWLLACLLVFQLIESSPVYLNGEPEIFKARAVIRGMAGSRSIHGALNFEQFSVDGPVIISGTIRGLRPGLHGLHIHQNGNLSDSCKAAGPHFNPFNKTHGSPMDLERHLGDLGNIESYPGNPPRAFVYHVDSVISLAGPSDYSVLYRAVVIHSKRDDLGRGGHADSLATGDSGQRVACGLIVTV